MHREYIWQYVKHVLHKQNSTEKPNNWLFTVHTVFWLSGQKKMFTINQTSLLHSIRNIFTTFIMFIIMQLRFMDLYYLTNCGKYMLTMIKTKYEQAYQALTKQHFRQLYCYKIVRRTWPGVVQICGLCDTSTTSWVQISNLSSFNDLKYNKTCLYHNYVN